jgi:hypothetical protein
MNLRFVSANARRSFLALAALVFVSVLHGCGEEGLKSDGSPPVSVRGTVRDSLTADRIQGVLVPTTWWLRMCGTRLTARVPTPSRLVSSSRGT